MKTKYHYILPILTIVTAIMASSGRNFSIKIGLILTSLISAAITIYSLLRERKSKQELSEILNLVHKCYPPHQVKVEDLLSLLKMKKNCFMQESRLLAEKELLKIGIFWAKDFVPNYDINNNIFKRQSKEIIQNSLPPTKAYLRIINEESNSNLSLQFFSNTIQIINNLYGTNFTLSHLDELKNFLRVEIKKWN